MKPIVKGCKAITYGSLIYENNNIEVKIGNYLGKVPGWAHDDRWEIDQKIKGISMIGEVRYAYHMSAKHLMRIDDPDIQKQIEEEREKELC